MPYPDSTYEQQWREARNCEPVSTAQCVHTPGPWDVDDDTMEIFSVQPGHSIGWVAKVLGNDDNGRPLSPAEMAANALLIAAAPDLLAALIEMRNEFTSNGCDGQHSACRMADAAIKKAGGE